MQVSVCPWFGKRMLHLRKLPLVRTLSTYPKALPLIWKVKMAPGSWCGHPKEKWSNISMMLRPLRPWANGGSCGLCTQDVLTSLDIHTGIGMADSENRLRPGPWCFMLRMEVKVFFFMWVVGAHEPLQNLLRSTLVSPPGDPAMQTHPQSSGFQSYLWSPKFWRMELLMYTLVFKLCESHSFLFLCDLWILMFPRPYSRNDSNTVFAGDSGQGEASGLISGLHVRVHNPLDPSELQNLCTNETVGRNYLYGSIFPILSS